MKMINTQEKLVKMLRKNSEYLGSSGSKRTVFLADYIENNMDLPDLPDGYAYTSKWCTVGEELFKARFYYDESRECWIYDRHEKVGEIPVDANQFNTTQGDEDNTLEGWVKSL